MPDEEPNEILEASRAAKAQHEAAVAKEAEAKVKRWQIGKFGLGVGIGSAAVLFANRDRK